MLRGIWVSLLAIVTTALFSAVATVWSLVRPRSDVAMRIGKLWSRIHLAACGIRPVIRGRENLEGTGPCLYLANHQSTLDIWLTILVLPLPTRIVAKQQLFRIPILGWALTASGFIPIDRSNHTRALHSLRAAATKVRAGRRLLLFPEGTRSRDGTLRPFKKGAFHLALQAGVPVVPISLRGTYEALPPRTIRVTPGPVEVVIHPPVDVTPYEPADVAGLSAVVREAIAAGLQDDAGLPGVPAAGAAER